MAEKEGTFTRKAVQRLLSWAYFYMRFRLRTEKEMRMYLSQKAAKYGYDAVVVEETMKELCELDLINDLRFVETYVLSHQHVRQKSLFLLKNELLRKGVEDDIINSYFEKNPLNEEELITESITKRWARYSHLNKIKRFKKAHDFLRRKGFPYELVKKTIEEMEEKR